MFYILQVVKQIEKQELTKRGLQKKTQ